MSDEIRDEPLLLIRCPSCGQRFKVGDDLMGRTVECGACEHRFRINDQVIVRGKKFYPGERRNARLNRFQRVPLAVAPPVVGTPTVRYAEPPDPAKFEPATPERIVAGFVGVGGMVLMALLLIFGASRGGILDGMTTQNRLLMAGFTGLLGTALLAYANPRARAKAIGVGLLMGFGLILLPLNFRTGSIPLGTRTVEAAPAPAAEEGAQAAVSAAATAASSKESEAITELRGRIGTEPLEAEIKRLEEQGGSRRAVGLWLRDLREQNRFLVKDFILRVTGADPQSHYYPRGNGNFLMVVTGVRMSLEEVAATAAALGSVENMYPEIAVAEIRVNNENFVEGPIDKLADRNHPAFYDLNKRELESIDLQRVEKAVKRLAEAEPKIYRSDITRKLISLLGSPGVGFKGAICQALAVWSDEPGPAGKAALEEVGKLMVHNVTVPEEMVALIVKEKNPEVLPVLDELWDRNPMIWESLYGDLGRDAEPALLRRFPTTAGSQRYSAVRLLGRVGGADSLPVLGAVLSGADPELRVLLVNSMQSIRDRMAR